MRQNVEEVCAKFDQSVDRLRGGRMQAEFAVAALERRMVRLALVADEMLRYSDEKELELQQALTKADQNLNKKSTEVIEVRDAAPLPANQRDISALGYGPSSCHSLV